MAKCSKTHYRHPNPFFSKEITSHYYVHPNPHNHHTRMAQGSHKDGTRMARQQKDALEAKTFMIDAPLKRLFPLAGAGF